MYTKNRCKISALICTFTINMTVNMKQHTIFIQMNPWIGSIFWSYKMNNNNDSDNSDDSNDNDNSDDDNNGSDDNNNYNDNNDEQ